VRKPADHTSESGDTGSTGSGAGFTGGEPDRCSNFDFDSIRGRLRGRRCLIPSSRLSQTRSVSDPICTPSRRSPPTSDSTDAPSRRSRSNSSRCAVSCAVARLRGYAHSATAWARVGGEPVANSERIGGCWGVIRQQYAQRLGGAMGAGRDWSKPKGLDVGVSHFCFVFLFHCFERFDCSRWFVFDSVELGLGVTSLCECILLLVAGLVEALDRSSIMLVLSQCGASPC
jgi:hypothetical protein